MSKLFKTEGVVIRKVNFGEADCIVTLLTPDRGKIACLAKGCRRFTSRLCGRLELFYQIRVIGFPGRNLSYIKEAEVLDDVDFFDLPLPHLHALASVTEVTCKLIQDEQCVKDVYPLLCETSRSLKAGNNLQTDLEQYLQRLLSLLGFMPPTEKNPLTVLRTILNGPLKSEGFLVPVR